MKVIKGFKDREFEDAGAVALTLGVFDGVHLGHRRIVETLISEARRLNGTAALLTFDPHPRKLLYNNNGPRLLTSMEHKIHLLAELGLDYCIVLRFDREMAQETPTDFVVKRLLGSMNLKCVCVGPRFSFGCKRSGNAELLQGLGEKYGFYVRIVEGVRIDGVHVSSTVIREMVNSGDLKKASRLLGRPYSIVGRVVEGKALGRKLGIPTANLISEGEVVPPAGVYAVAVKRDEKLYRGVLNIDLKGCVEAHLLDFNETIYGKLIEVVFGEFIRSEKKFASRDDLVRQVRCDIEIAKEILHNEGALNTNG